MQNKVKTRIQLQMRRLSMRVKSQFGRVFSVQHIMTRNSLYVLCILLNLFVIFLYTAGFFNYLTLSHIAICRSRSEEMGSYQLLQMYRLVGSMMEHSF
jgi:hypothetical protein